MQSNLITLSEGISMTSMFRREQENILAENFKNAGILPICETFDRAAFDTLLSNPKCTGIRIYTGMNETFRVSYVIVGVTSDSKDLYIGGSENEGRVEIN